VMQFEGQQSESLAKTFAAATNSDGSRTFSSVAYANGVAEVYLRTSGAGNLLYTNIGSGMNIEVWDLSSNQVMQRVRYEFVPPSNSVTILATTITNVSLALATNQAGVTVTSQLNPHAVFTGPDAADLWPPALTISATNGVVTIQASDDGTGVSGVFVSLDGAPFTPYITPVFLNFGSYLTAYAEDQVQNRSAPVTYARILQLRWERDAHGTLALYWPKGTGILQETPSLSTPTWTNSTKAVQIVNVEEKTEFMPSENTRFFRISR
jgi:hypothetical protein